MKIIKLSKYFVLFFLLSFLVINWGEFNWVLNSRVVFGLASEFFKNSENPAVALAREAVQEVVGIKKEEEKEKPLAENTGSIEIPKLNVSAPLVFNETVIRKELFQALDNGVVFYPTSVLPTESGQSVFLGHSGPPKRPRLKYDWVFSRLNELKEGDLIYLYFNGEKFTYTVRHTVFLDRGEQIPEHPLTNLGNVIILVSCWPPGKDVRRIAVMADR